jgi:hypothetical protein
VKAAKIVPPLPVIETEDLLIQVTVKMEPLDSNIGATEVPLHQRPEVFQAVRVDVAANVFNGMIDRLKWETSLNRPLPGNPFCQANHRAVPLSVMELCLPLTLSVATSAASVYAGCPRAVK